MHQVTDPNNDLHTQVWTSSLSGELWHKENLINLAIQELTIWDPDWRYVAWVDADVKFESGIIEKTAHALQHWDVVQMWSHAIDFCPKGGVVSNRVHNSYMYGYWNPHLVQVPLNSPYMQGGHPGYAWAARRDALNKLGGLIDFAALGSGDRHMACALVGRVGESVHGKTSHTYRRLLNLWQDRAERNIKRNVGYVDGTIRHLWHGKKASRGYNTRWQILVKHQFNPETDLKRDVSGVWQLVVEDTRQRNQRDDFRKYFLSRNEDSIDV